MVSSCPQLLIRSEFVSTVLSRPFHSPQGPKYSCLSCHRCEFVPTPESPQSTARPNRYTASQDGVLCHRHLERLLANRLPLTAGNVEQLS